MLWAVIVDTHPGRKKNLLTPLALRRATLYDEYPMQEIW